MSFAWSESRVKTLRNCARKYYYIYFLSNGGWYQNASEESKKAYLLKKMTNIYMYTGTVVHDIIESILKNTNKSVDLSLTEANAVFAKGVLQSKNCEWKKSPSKAINLFEHYYKGELNENYAYSKIHKCMNALYNSEVFDMIKRLGKNDKITMEEFQSFKLKTGEDVAVKLDFAFRFNGKVYLIDWKTGKPNYSINEQLDVYAMHSLKMKWVKNLDEVVLMPVYLGAKDSNEIEIPLETSMDQLMARAEIIKTEFPLLILAEKNKKDIGKFPVTDNINECEKCNFKEICEGADRV